MPPAVTMVNPAPYLKKKIKKRSKKFTRHQSGIAFGPSNGRYSVKVRSLPNVLFPLRMPVLCLLLLFPPPTPM